MDSNKIKTVCISPSVNFILGGLCVLICLVLLLLFIYLYDDNKNKMI